MLGERNLARAELENIESIATFRLSIRKDSFHLVKRACVAPHHCIYKTPVSRNHSVDQCDSRRFLRRAELER